MLFVFSITPKKYFHDLIADHTDQYAATHSHAPSLTDAGFNCHFENLVAESPFTITESLKFQPASRLFLINDFNSLPGDLSTFSPAKDNKGPPASPAA